MAQVARPVSDHAELLLGLCSDAWARLPDSEATIDEWDLIDQIVFIEEWPLEEERLRVLEQYAKDGTLTPEQLNRYDELKRVVAVNRPIIRRLQQT